MTRLLRFRDLKERQIVQSWPQLRRMVREYGFPPGMLLGPNTRAWSEQVVEDWLADRPTAPKPDPRRGDGAATAGNSADEIGREKDVRSQPTVRPSASGHDPPKGASRKSPSRRH